MSPYDALRVRTWTHCARVGVCVAFAGMLGSGVIRAAPEKCSEHLEVKFDPSVSNMRAPSFLNSLVASPMYQLTWVDGSDSTAVYELTGPATDHDCENEIELLKKNANVMDVKVLPADVVAPNE